MKKTVSYYYELDSEISKKIISDIVLQGEVATSTAYMWMQGKRKPLPLYQKLIQMIIKKYYNETVSRKELFS